MQNNLIYLCGPHGSGKTTLGKKLKERNPRIKIPELFSRNVKFNTDADYRQILKICGRAIENFEYLEIAKENPSEIILGNRCIYDVLAYNWVYFGKGWIDEETFENYNKHTLDFFRNENSNPRAIVLNPGIDVVLSHLEKRWAEKGKKWREEDKDYARLACSAYSEFSGKKDILYIDHEINLNSDKDFDLAEEWIMDGIKERRMKENYV